MSEHPFLRNEMLWGAAAQEKLSRSHVIVFGLGGVGSYTAECLARSGIGELTIVDNDVVSLTNRNRQLEALSSTLGQRKTDAVAARLLDINPDLVVHPIFGTYNAENREQFFPAGAAYDYIADAIEPNRRYPGVEALRKAVWEDLDRGCLMSINHTINYVSGQGHFLDPDTLLARDDFMKKENCNE